MCVQFYLFRFQTMMLIYICESVNFCKVIIFLRTYSKDLNRKKMKKLSKIQSVILLVRIYMCSYF